MSKSIRSVCLIVALLRSDTALAQLRNLDIYIILMIHPS